jgi:hypothetical protein
MPSSCVLAASTACQIKVVDVHERGTSTHRIAPGQQQLQQLSKKRGTCMLTCTAAECHVRVRRVLKIVVKGNNKQLQHEVAAADPAGMGSKLAAQ